MAARKKGPSAVKEPVQVYLEGPDSALLDRVAKKAELSKAEVLRRGLRAFGAEILAKENPILKLIHEFENADWPDDAPADLSINHDRHLAESYADTHAAKRKQR